MLKKALFAGALVALCAVAPRPAAAQNSPVFFEPYGEIFSARPILPSAADTRPKDARTGQPSKRENPNQRIAIQGGVYDTDDTFLAGGGVAYGNASNARHPWSISVFGNNLTFDGFDDDFMFLDVTGKLVLWQPTSVNAPVVALVVNYQDTEDIGDTLRFVVAADQRLTDELYGTVNLGYSMVDTFGFDDEGLFAGVGLTYAPRRWNRLSLSANYNFDTDVSGDDTFSVSAIWAFGRTASVQVGGGDDSKVFANFRANLDIR